MRFKIAQSDRVALQQPHPAARRARVRLPRHHRAEARRAGLRAARRQAARRACRSPAISSSATPIRTPARARSARRISWSQHARDAEGSSTASPPTSSRAASSTRITSSSAYRALAEAFPERSRSATIRTRALTVEEAIRFGQAIEDLRNDYLEDPAWGLNGMRRLREMVRIPLATNTVVVNFEQLAANVLDPAVDVILLDTTFWGGIRPCVKAAGVCETFQLGDRGAFLGRARHSARDDAAPRRGAAEPRLRRRRALSPPGRRHDRRRPDAVRGRRDRGARPARPRRHARPREAARSTPSSTASSAAIPTTAIPAGPAGMPLVPNDRWADPTVSLSPRLR